MELIAGADAVPDAFGPSAVTIGKFDGVHRGHIGVIGQLCALADERGVAPVVVTFDRNPLSLFAPEKAPEPLTSRAQRAELLAAAGVATTVELVFDHTLAGQQPDAFVRDLLVDRLGARAVLAGADFRFGARGAGDVPLLRELGGGLGFDVELIADVEIDGGRVSSSRIRSLLAEGDVAAAAGLLGRRHRVRSTVVPGDRRGRELGFPTANLDPAIEGYLPADAVYAAWARIDGERHAAAVSIGNNPTFEGVPARRTEAHLLDVDADLYGREIELEFVERVRGMLRFDGVDELIAALTADVAAVRGILADAS